MSGQLAPGTDPTPTKDPPTLLRAAGLCALLVMIVVDAKVPDWNPDRWTYLIVALMVWGPKVLRR